MAIVAVRPAADGVLQQHAAEDHQRHALTDLRGAQGAAIAQCQRQQAIDDRHHQSRGQTAEHARRRDANQAPRAQGFGLFDQRRDARQQHQRQYRGRRQHRHQHEGRFEAQHGGHAQQQLTEHPRAVEHDHVKRQQTPAHGGVGGAQQPALDDQIHPDQRPADHHAQQEPHHRVITQPHGQCRDRHQRGEAGIGADMADAQQQAVVDQRAEPEAQIVGRADQADRLARDAGSRQPQRDQRGQHGITDPQQGKAEQGRKGHQQQMTGHDQILGRPPVSDQPMPQGADIVGRGNLPCENTSRRGQYSDSPRQIQAFLRHLATISSCVSLRLAPRPIHALSHALVRRVGARGR